MLKCTIPLPEVPTGVPIPAEHICLMEYLSSTPVSVSQIRTLTSSDLTLAKVRDYMQHGWPPLLDKASELQPYIRQREESSIEEGYLLCGHRVVILPQAGEKVITELHKTHPGTCKMRPSRDNMYMYMYGALTLMKS